MAMDRNKQRKFGEDCWIKGVVVIVHDFGKSGPAKLASLQIYSATELDPKTGNEKLSKKAKLEEWRSKKKSDGSKISSYKVKLKVEKWFGIPGAFLITNQHKHKFFLRSAFFQISNHSQIIHFDCNSWVYPINLNASHYLFFSNTSYIPSQTPSPLMELRKLELIKVRGDGRREIMEEWENIYEYDYYNHVGNSQEHSRLIIGGSSSLPYPRRLRTLHPSNEDVAADERMSYNKVKELASNTVEAALQFLIPILKTLNCQPHIDHFKSFVELHCFFWAQKPSNLAKADKWTKLQIQKFLPQNLFQHILSQKHPFIYPLPQFLRENEHAWMDDDEFARQMLAGTNPVRITCLHNFPPESKTKVVSTIKAPDIEHNLDGLTLQQAIEDRRIFMLDHHDYLMPFLNRINSGDVFAYASRTLLFLRSDSTLKPLAIELSLPYSEAEGEEISWVYLPAAEGLEAALWQLAKAHVAANDSVYHQLVSHWLHTHAVVEPFIIATRRQLSVMHPIYRLLNPHFKDTLHINSLFRSFLLRPDGIFEKILFSGKYSMELSSELYKEWRFDEHGLPADLLKRNMAVRDPDPGNPTGVRLIFPDYPYAEDGLEIWTAIKTWVKSFCSIFYRDDDSVHSDEELQAWWSEIRNVGHGDKSHESGWYEMTTLSDLVEALTTLIWTATGLHAAVNSGQYAYASYPLNRPTLCHKFIPSEGTVEYAKLLSDPDKYYLEMLPGKFETALGVALTKVLSHHAKDELYLGRRSPYNWTDNARARYSFSEFSKELKNIEKRIEERNRDPNRKNRNGPAKIPYKLLFPDTSNFNPKGGIAGKGIPNSISI
ncbi:linoleate 9S-lipoxygenase-like isoform X2 [Benincasa hispida]|uniref:linoleate 9S-lipoxygenase-like isoform X2 n=1 Tax=Benincasa hispida TaxID=102211 RepID=UPI0018FF586B|nr:linoleate 9S-lipoxygenase-like isoform X2 [Benincasa hispida]